MIYTFNGFMNGGKNTITVDLDAKTHEEALQYVLTATNSPLTIAYCSHDDGSTKQFMLHGHNPDPADPRPTGCHINVGRHKKWQINTLAMCVIYFVLGAATALVVTLGAIK